MCDIEILGKWSYKLSLMILLCFKNVICLAELWVKFSSSLRNYGSLFSDMYGNMGQNIEPNWHVPVNN